MKKLMSERIADERRAALTANIELQLREGHDNAPLLKLLQRANEAAAAAMAQMVDVDATKIEIVQKLQNEIRCFDLIVAMLADVTRDGFEAADAISQERREDISDLLGLNDYEANEALAGEL